MVRKQTETHGEESPEMQPKISHAALIRPQTLADIEMREPDSKEIWYGHSILTSTLFPPTQPAAGTDFVSKTNGTLEYVLEAGIDPEERKRKFPYGKYPRLVMAWIAKQIRAAGRHKTEYVDPETRTITIPSIWQLCNEMGLPRGGKTADKIQEQLRLLLSSHITIRRTTGFAGGKLHDMVSLPIVEAVRFKEDDANAAFSGSAFVLTQEVYNRLARESAPFDTRASSLLLSGRSVLPYDVYVWITGSMKNLDHDLPVSWDWLYERFGDGIADMRNFRLKFRRALDKVSEVYPAARFTVTRKAVILHPSPTAIAAHPKSVETTAVEE
ncbi:replication protein RepA [Bifidobacterium sp. SO4]|uniref:replication protein RepA n=1 Tax=Bifidobacterium sp. SO4 TaxID=2809030 RepID=UPI001F0A7A44|nr:replication protein RepA [Bifidobacterium sp. SO4]